MGNESMPHTISMTINAEGHGNLFYKCPPNYDKMDYPLIKTIKRDQCAEGHEFLLYKIIETEHTICIKIMAHVNR